MKSTSEFILEVSHEFLPVWMALTFTQEVETSQKPGRASFSSEDFKNIGTSSRASNHLNET